MRNSYPKGLIVSILKPVDYSKNDIVSRHFSKKFLGGLDEFEVRDFLHVLAEEIRHLEQLIFNQKKRLHEQDEQIRDYRDREHILKKSISSAQAIADRIRKDTEIQAQMVMDHAHQKAESIIQEARLSLQTVYSDINDLKRLQLQFKTGLKASLESHLEFLQGDSFMTSSLPGTTNQNSLESNNLPLKDSPLPESDLKEEDPLQNEDDPLQNEDDPLQNEDDEMDPIPRTSDLEFDSLKQALRSPDLEI